MSFSASSTEEFKGLTPVLIDDIISTGRTMVKTADWLANEGLNFSVCIAAYALFSDDALAIMQQAKIEKVLTCSTVVHETNEIDISNLLINRY